jgi:hypothetical protein
VSIFSTVVGRWSDVPPVAAGIYLARVTWDRASPYVAYWRPPECDEPRGSTVWQFLYLPGDADGAPTRADERRLWGGVRRHRA